MKEKNKDRIDFHVQCDDTFATLATVLYFLEEELGKAEETLKLTRKNLLKAKEDLIYLQEAFKIISRRRIKQVRIMD